MLLAPGVGPGSRERARSAPRAEFHVALLLQRASQILRLGEARLAPRRTRGGNVSTQDGKLRKQQLLAAHAHRMRVGPSEPERVLWQAIRSRRLGVQFRRQAVLHGYIVDFFAPAARLVVEVDGAHHAQRRGADKRRDASLVRAGLRVLRIPAAMVLQTLGVALELITRAL
jgi:very-short-patch-repair endonuclease